MDGKSFVHPTAIICPDVVIERDVYIGPYCVIGGLPEHREFYDGKESKGVIIKAGAKIFSHVTIDSGTIRRTTIGQGTAIFNKAHVAHDCFIGSNVTIGGSVSLAGHTYIMDGANVSGHSCSFQRVVIGAYSFIGGMSFVTGDVPPGGKWVGSPARYIGQNEVGLARVGLTIEECQSRYQKKFTELVDDKTRV
jgi:UDP-N-acetylglucosamine acyltransferase